MRPWARAVVGLVSVVVVLALALVSLSAGVIDAGPVGSILLVAVDTRVLLGVAVAIFAVSLLLYLLALRREDPGALADDGPSVEAVVPVYRDAGVIHRSVEALVASEYRNLAVTIVPEPDDGSSLDRARALASEHDAVTVLVNDACQGSKAGALNAAIEASDADVLALFDADQRPHPKLLSHAVAALEGIGTPNPDGDGGVGGDSARDDVRIARVRSLPDPSGGLVESEAYYEYLLLFFLPQKLVRAVLGLQVVGTRSVLVERDVFEEVGRFAEDHLAEDLDFTHRCHQAGIGIRELLYYPTAESPAHTLRDWWGQRVRWMTGQVQVSGSHLGGWRRLTDPGYLGSLLSLLGTLVAGALLATAAPKIILGLAWDPLVVGGLLAGLYAVCLLTRALDNRTAGLSGAGFGWLVIPLGLTLYGLVIVQVVLSRALGRETVWYSTEKQG